MEKRKVLKQRKLTRARFLGNCTAIPKGKLGWVYWDDFALTFGFLFERDFSIREGFRAWLRCGCQNRD